MSVYRRTPNLLLIGPDIVTRAYLDRLMASLPSPVRFCDSAAPCLPAEPVRGLVVRDVERLKRADQDQLLTWLNGNGYYTRVVSTSGTSFFPMVERGEFSDALYYRINVVTLLLDRPPA